MDAEMDLTQLRSYSAVDFEALANKHPGFQTLWKESSGRLNFHDPATVQTLSQAILKTDFDLNLQLPPDRLCPPIPNRWNYVAWIQQLLDSTSPSYKTHYDPDRRVTGLDIGTGASAIYTMLCLRSRPTWTMCATDIDKKSFDSAILNLTLNGLVTRTKMLQTTPAGPLIPLQHLGVANSPLDFTMCNPPFFLDEADMKQSLHGESKDARPNAVCTGAVVEMACPGGDLGFVTRMVEESLVLRERVTWYSSMLGKLSSAKQIVGLLKSHGIDNWAVGRIETGGATRRWVVGWSFGELRPRNDVARIENVANEFLPFPTEYRIALAPGVDVAVAEQTLVTHLSSLDLRWKWDEAGSTGIGEASQNVWKRAYRREHERKRREMAAGSDVANVDMGDGPVDRKVALAFRVSVVHDAGEIVLEWLRGRDQVMWESFCGMLHGVFKK